MYKDKDKQREANRARQKRRRDKIKAQGVTNQGVTQGVTVAKPCMSVAALSEAYVAGFVESCMKPDYICPIPKDQRKPYINYGPYMTANELATAGLKFNRVSKPGDADYNGICIPEWRAERGRGIQGSVSVQPSLSVKRSVNH